MSMCLVRSWNKGLAAMCRAALLSQYNVAGSEKITPMSENKPVIQTISQEVVAMALYSASAEDLQTVLCFLVPQDTKESPNLIQKPVSDLRVIGQDAQSESQ